LRRELRSAERLSEAAIFFGLVSLKTPCCRSSASLSRVTRCDQRFGEVFPAADFPRAKLDFRTLAVFFRVAGLRVGVLRARAVFRLAAIFNSMLFQPKTTTKLIRSFAAMRELTCPEGVDQRWLARTYA
jgi:hypothetical protein